MTQLFFLIFSISLFATETKTIEIVSGQNQYNIQLKRDLVKKEPGLSCSRDNDGNENCTQVWHEVPLYNLEANLKIDIDSSELKEFKQPLTFEMDRFGKISIKEAKTTVLVVSSLEAQSPIRDINDQKTRNDFYKLRILDKAPIEKFLKEKITSLDNEGAVLLFQTQTPPSNFRLKFEIMVGKKCKIWYGDEIDLTGSDLVKEKVLENGNSQFSIDMEEVEVEEGIRIMRRKTCVNIATRMVPKDLQSFEKIIGSPWTSEDHLFQ